MAEPTFAQQMLTKIETMLLGKADNDVAKYEIAGRSLEKYSFSELQTLRRQYKGEVKAEQVATDLAAGLGNPRRKVLTRF
ncbi:hypothetical protein [Sulfurimonas sp.]|uniref:hypothetical protein n=1 Tax=Sulfurimonas sp. TaxID=2022749 RepID=UPI0025E2CFB3|nr:hypothetical protein [Sulfurimonas sp.]